MVKIHFSEYPIRLKRFATLLAKDIEKEVLPEFLSRVVRGMVRRLEPHRRPVAEPEWKNPHFTFTLDWKVARGPRGMEGIVFSHYPRKPGVVAWSIDRGRRAYRVTPPRVIVFRKPTGELVYTRRVRATQGIRYIAPSFIEQRSWLRRKAGQTIGFTWERVARGG